MIDEVKINRSGSKTTSVQIAQFFRSKILNRELGPGERLPTTLEIVGKMGIGSHTVRKAMSLLENEGLVESTPRRGTFVTGESSEPSSIKNISMEPDALIKNFKSSSMIKVGVMGSTGIEGNEPGKYRPETMAGILKEGDRLGAITVVLPFALRSQPETEIYDLLVSAGCQGVIWPDPVLDEWDKIEAFNRKGLATFATRRWRDDDGRTCIESDYEGAGFISGKFFLENECNGVTLFTYYNDEDASAKTGGMYPIGVKQGLSRAYECKFGESSKIKVKCLRGYTDTNDNEIIVTLRSLAADDGVLFTNGYQFLHLLKNGPKEVCSLLSNRRIVVISNYTINIKLATLVNDLDFHVLIDPFEDIAKLAFQKVILAINGYRDEATTLVKIGFKRFNDLII